MELVVDERSFVLFLFPNVFCIQSFMLKSWSIIYICKPIFQVIVKNMELECVWINSSVLTSTDTVAQVQSVIYFLKELIFNNFCRSLGSPKFQVFRRSVCRIISNMTWNVRGDSKMKNSSKIQIQILYVDCQLRLGHSVGREKY